MAKKNNPVSAVGSAENAKEDHIKDDGDDALTMSDEPSPNKDLFKTMVADAKADRESEKAKELAAVEIEPDIPSLIMSTEVPKARTDFVVQAKAEDQEFDFQIKPSFVSMTEEDVQKWLKEMTNHLRDRGAVVTTLDVQEIDGLCEAKYQWRYQEDQPVTIVASAKTALDAVRMVAEEVSARRHEV